MMWFNKKGFFESLLISFKKYVHIQLPYNEKATKEVKIKFINQKGYYGVSTSAYSLNPYF